MEQNQKIYKFLSALLDVYRYIQLEPNSNCHDLAIAAFNKHLSCDLLLQTNLIKNLTNEILDIPKYALKNVLLAIIGETDDNEKQGFIRRVDISYVISHLPVLKSINSEMLEVLRISNTEQIRDLAKAIHNYPQMLINRRIWSPWDIWAKDIQSYRRTWDNSFLQEWEKLFKEC